MDYDSMDNAPRTTLPYTMLRFINSVLDIVICNDLSYGVILSELWWDKRARGDSHVQSGVREMWEAFGCVFGYEKQQWITDENERVWFYNRDEFREELRTRHFSVSFHVLYKCILMVLRRLAREAALVRMMKEFAAIVNKQ